MMGSAASAQAAGDTDPVARAGTAPCKDALISRTRGTKERECSRNSAGNLGKIASHNRNTVGTAHTGNAPVEQLQPPDADGWIDRKSDNCDPGDASHGSNVAEISLKELRSGSRGRNVVVKMLPIDDRIDGNELKSL